MRTTFPVTPPPEGWAALGDAERLAAALPGCRSVTRDADGDGTLHVVTDVSVASVRGLWAGTVVPVDADAVRVSGSGAPGTVDLVVRAGPERTSLTIDGTVEGPLGTVGSAVLAAAIRRTAVELATAAATAATASTAAGAEPQAAGAAAAEPSEPARGHGYLGLGASERMTSASSASAPPGRRLVRVSATVTGVIAGAAIAAGRWRRAHRSSS